MGSNPTVAFLTSVGLDVNIINGASVEGAPLYTLPIKELTC